MKPITKVSLICSCIFAVALIVLIGKKYDSIIPQQQEENDEYISPHTGKKVSQESINGYFEIALKQMIAYEDLVLDSVTVIKGIDNAPLQKYMSGKSFVLFYPQHFCGECFQKDLEYYNLIAERYPQKTFLISTGLSNRDLLFFKKDHDVKSEVYHITTPQKDLFTELIEPCFFMLDENMRVSLFFNPDPEHPDMSEWHFEKIYSLLKKL